MLRSSEVSAAHLLDRENPPEGDGQESTANDGSCAVADREEKEKHRLLPVIRIERC